MLKVEPLEIKSSGQKFGALLASFAFISENAQPYSSISSTGTLRMLGCSRVFSWALMNSFGLLSVLRFPWVLMGSHVDSWVSAGSRGSHVLSWVELEGVGEKLDFCGYIMPLPCPPPACVQANFSFRMNSSCISRTRESYYSKLPPIRSQCRPQDGTETDTADLIGEAHHL